MTTTVTISTEALVETRLETRNQEGELITTKTYIIPAGNSLLLEITEFEELTITQSDIILIGA